MFLSKWRDVVFEESPFISPRDFRMSSMSIHFSMLEFDVSADILRA